MRFSHEIKNKVFFSSALFFLQNVFVLQMLPSSELSAGSSVNKSLAERHTKLLVSFIPNLLPRVSQDWVARLLQVLIILLHNNSCFEIPQPLALYNVLNFLNSLLFFFLLSLWVLPLFLALFLFLFLFGFVFLFLLGVVGIGSLLFLF